MTPPSAMFIVGALLFAAGVKRRAQSPFNPVAGHQQTQDLRRRFGL